MLKRADIYGYWDTTEEFVNRINNISSLNRMNQIKIVTPFITFRKGDIIKEGLKLKVDYSKTTSCYNGKNKPCLICSTCSERLRGFKDNNMEDPLIAKMR